MNSSDSTYCVDERGFFGRYGGVYVPEILKPNTDALSACYRQIIESEAFQHEYHSLLRDYVGRPSPLWLSPSLSRRYGRRVYLKREDLNHTGAHKINNALGQILLARAMGKTRIIAETGAGQHGLATATVCALFDMPCTVYMGQVDIARQQPNVAKMRLLGADVRAVESGNQTLKDAVNEALRDWCSHPSETFYLMGSAVGPHPYPDLVERLQAVISEEICAQLLEKEGRKYPDMAVACLGGGSNAAGTFHRFLNEKSVRLVCAEADGLGIVGKSAATIIRGCDGILHGARTIVMQDEDGQITEPYSISAGLDYPGVGPLHAHLAQSGRAEMVAVTDGEALAAAYELNRSEGILPAIESAHALAALSKLKWKHEQVVVVTLSGRGDKDIETYLKHCSKYINQ